MDDVPFGRVVYCRMADTEGWNNNTFKCPRFWLPEIKDGRHIELTNRDLKQGDLVHFRPLVPVLGSGVLGIVHTVTDSGRIILGNLNVSQEQLIKLNLLHLTGVI